MLSNKKLNTRATDLFTGGKKLNISLVFITQSYFAVPENIRLYSTHYFIMKIPNKQELQQIAFNHSSDFDFRNFMNLYITDAILASDIPSHFKLNLLERIEKLIMTVNDKI